MSAVPKPVSDRTILEISDLHVEFDTYGGVVKAVRGVELSVRAAKTLAIVGESGCGKSVTVQSIMGLIPMPPGRITRGTAVFDGVDIIRQKIVRGTDVRGSRIGMIFQDPMSSLNPTMTVGDQIAETLEVHRGYSKDKAVERAVELLALSHIPEPAQRARQYPFTFSGGMLQRAMIAMSIACEPDILIADEPTTALDVTIQAQILDLLEELQRKKGMAIVLITHDLGGRRANGGRRRRHVRGRDHRERQCRRRVLPVRAPVHARFARCDAEQRDGENGRVAADRGHAAGSLQSADRLPVFRALPARDADLRAQPPAALRCRPRALFALLATARRGALDRAGALSR